MDPLRGVIHLGLKLTEATLDRALDVVRLADTLLVAGAVPPAPETGSNEPAWPAEEQADLDALSATLRARQDTSAATKGATKKSAPRKTAQKAAPAKTTTRAKKSAPATKKSAPSKTAQKAAPAKTTTRAKKSAPATKGATKKSTPSKTAQK